jgi:dihydroorotase
VFVDDSGRFAADWGDTTAVQTVNCDGLILAPSLVDLEAQLGDPGLSDREDFKSGGAAAAAGGFTTVLISPATQPVVDDAAILREIRRRAPTCTEVEILVPGALTKGLAGKELAEMGLLAAAGATVISNGATLVCNTATLRYALMYARPFGLTVFLRAGEKELEASGAMNEGDLSTAIGLRGLPPVAEEIGIGRLVALTRSSGASLHISGITTARGVELIAAAKAEGLPISASTTAHHLLLADTAVRDSVYNPNTRLMPPLRSETDRAALCAAVIAGTLDAVCTQHEPLTRAEKEFEFELATPGAIGLQTALNETVEALEGDFGAAIQALSIGPAGILGLDRGIRVGDSADFLLWDPNKMWTPSPDSLFSRCANSPVLGRPFKGQVIRTFRAGREIHRTLPVP